MSSWLSALIQCEMLLQATIGASKRQPCMLRVSGDPLALLQIFWRSYRVHMKISITSGWISCCAMLNSHTMQNTHGNFVSLNTHGNFVSLNPTTLNGRFPFSLHFPYINHKNLNLHHPSALNPHIYPLNIHIYPFCVLRGLGTLSKWVNNP